MQGGTRAACRRSGIPRPAATLRQEVTLRMAAMARQPAVSTGGVEAVVVHPADRIGNARCLDAGPLLTDAYDDVSVRLLATGDAGRVIGTARITLWSPTVGFLVERTVGAGVVDLPLGPRAAELSGVVTAGSGREQVHTFVTMTRLAARVATAHGLDFLYVLASGEQLSAIAGPGVEVLTATAICIDLRPPA